MTKQSEEAVQAACRVRAGELGIHVWRNNVGAMEDASGRVVRYGLANDSAQLNKRLKSSDLIGIIPVYGPAGLYNDGHTEWLFRSQSTLGIMYSVECKRSDWKYTGTEREVAQLAWIELIRKAGGRAGFAVTVAEFEQIVLGLGNGAPVA